MERDDMIESQENLTETHQDIHKMIEDGELGLVERLSNMHPVDIARVIEHLSPETKREVFDLLKTDTASEVILEVNDSSREQILDGMGEEKLTDMVEEMDSDDAADLISDLSEEMADSVLEHIPKEDAEEVQKLLEYEEDTAGGIMQAELVAVKMDSTVGWVIEHLRSTSEEIGEIHNVFVISKDNRLVGSVPLSRLILAKPETVVSSIMETEFPKVTPDLDQEEVARIFKKYDLVAVPVVNHEGRLVGRITVDDVVDVMEEEASEDFYKMAGVSHHERVFDPVSKSFKMRCLWLIINLATAVLAASVVGFFQDTIQALVLLAVYMPIVAGMGGNAGTQTITITVRGLALGELTYKNASKALRKEVLLGLANGLVIGLIAALVSYWWNGNYMLGVVICLAMVVNLMIAGLAGSLIPLILKRLRIDPALASSIFVTTFTDVGGFFFFLGLAAVFMRYGLL